MIPFRSALAAGALVFMSSIAWAQPSATTVGAGAKHDGSATVGSGGSAAAGGTSASTLGLGATSKGPQGTSSSIGSAGSAAAVNGKATSRTKIHSNPQMLHGQSKARAQDGGTWSRSMTQTKVRHGGDLSSRTMSMAHQPGGAPAKSKTRVR
jgi:hypothetical protein